MPRTVNVHLPELPSSSEYCGIPYLFSISLLHTSYAICRVTSATTDISCVISVRVPYPRRSLREMRRYSIFLNLLSTVFRSSMVVFDVICLRKPVRAVSLAIVLLRKSGTASHSMHSRGAENRKLQRYWLLPSRSKNGWIISLLVYRKRQNFSFLS